MPEEWGGDVPLVEVSAREKLGLDDLLEVILLVADVHELKANPHKPAAGVVIESQDRPHPRPVATVLVQSGTLNLRDVVVAGATWGRVKAMFDDRGRKIRRPSRACRSRSWVCWRCPQAGDQFQVFADEKRARVIAERADARNGAPNRCPPTARFKLTEFSARKSRAASTEELRVIVKADVSGFAGRASSRALLKLNEESARASSSASPHAGTGAITESDVSLAAATRAIIIGFNVRPGRRRQARGRRRRRRHPLLQYHLQPAGRGQGGDDRPACAGSSRM